VNLLIGENLSPKLVQLLAAKGVAAVHVAHIGMPGATDAELWRYAFDHDQVVVTINAADCGSRRGSICIPASSCCGPPTGYRGRSNGRGLSR
jgi:predicted nuclease of predicted toxin-antitoxin system